MDEEKKKSIEAAGFKVTTVKEFLGLTEEENQLIELKVAHDRRVRELRKASKMSETMPPEIEGLELFAYVGEDEFGSGQVGLKQARVPAGLVPIVVIGAHRDKAEGPDVRAQLQEQARRHGKTIRLVRFVAVDVVLEITP